MEYQNYTTQQGPETDIFHQERIQYGTFWERFAAAFIDGLILMIPNLILRYGIGDVTGELLNIVVNWLYFAMMESGTNQATFGKKAMNLKVTNTEGHRISFGQATGRYFGKIISAIILLIGYLMMLWDDKKQTLHDKMANTLVVKNIAAF